ncbi:hypothetical protein [Halobaculum sp. P14]|uniref:DUF7853 family protein n=1 Tax=Halobaculum sp. P14 TaxID=3421638 RepID=UPI003EB7114C
MPAPVRDRPTVLSFTREEAWVAHVALLAQLRAAVDADDSKPDYPEVDALEAVEADSDRFEPQHVRVIRDALVSYLGDAPVRDRAPGRDALQAVNAALH